jgi:carbon starvation protein
VLLQPRDYINSHQLVLAMGLLVVGLFAASLFGGGPDLTASAPAIAQAPADAPPIFPFLFITVACGAVSGFHCLVSSGTSSKQLDCETDAQYVGYGAMLLEGALAVVVIMCCCAGIGMGAVVRDTASGDYLPKYNEQGQQLTGMAAWRDRYNADLKTGWQEHNLAKKVGAFIEGGANFISALGVPLRLAVGIVAVLVASFAATTLDTATRLQRYVIQELGHASGLKITNKYLATGLAVGSGALVAVFAGSQPGSGGMLLWPLFGATNQLLAGLAFLVTVFYLWRRGKPVWFAAIPMTLMLIMPAWAMTWQIVNDWLPAGKVHLVVFGLTILGLQAWMMVEAALIIPRARGVLESQLPKASG